MLAQFAPFSARLLLIRPSNGICLTVRRISSRNFSSSTRVFWRFNSLADFRETNVQIPIGSSRNIWLNVLEPISQPASKRANVILYLPPGPLFSNGQSHGPACAIQGPQKPAHLDSFPSPQHALSSTTLSTVVTVNYRLGQVEEDGEQRHYYYPGPVHDTLAGFDWIYEHLNLNRLCVYGKHIGGSLAVMLALTEPRSITAIAAHEPMCDWTSLDDYCLKADPALEEGATIQDVNDNANNLDGTKLPSEEQAAKRRGRKKKISSCPPDLVPLLEARGALFQIPDNYFDSFASPVLFLRSAGKDTPKTFPVYHTGPDYPIPVLKIPPKEIIDGSDFTRYFEDLDLDLIPPSPPELESDLDKPIRRRKALSRWPPYGLEYNDRPGVKSGGLWGGKPNLPHVRIFVHSNLSEPELERDTAVMDAPVSISYSSEDGSALSSSGASDASGQVQEQVKTENASTLDEDGPNSTTPKKRTRRPRSLRKRKLETDGETILARQGGEMVSLMRNACFWGREKGYAEERVRAMTVPLPAFPGGTPNGKGNPIDGHEKLTGAVNAAGDDLSSVEEQAGRYFRDILEQEIKKR
ncbi:hypothetical protein AJ79_03114 [Helicocarpus griseus UAMH5409]|uniref:Alpha/beta hydrolase fold-3 domain-containing protein n=1 Tax=Helicocarpus griseus UAMH5409 TaxID=1447875 RepID=A0A2B7Y099_9EURO|nr:hypothetical protein AJ79_03114 [Helicocarpus griseus UAMH5409]